MKFVIRFSSFTLAVTLSLLAYSGCAGIGVTDEPAPEITEFRNLLPSLPNENGRNSTELDSNTLLGREAIAWSATGTEVIGDDFEFTTNQEMSFGLWQFPGLVNLQLIQVSTNVSFLDGNEYYVAISNYTANRWEFSGPFTGNVNVAFDVDKRYTSGADNLYVAVITTDFNVGFVHGLAINYDTLPAAFEISGNITDTEGSPLQGITIRTSPASGQEPVTDSSGLYIFVDIPPSEISIVPESSEYSFTPSSRVVSIVDANIHDVDFTGTPEGTTYSISGRLHDYSYFPIPGVTVTLTPGNIVESSDSSGNFEFSNLPERTYTLTPGSEFYTFSPLSKVEIVSGDDITGVNFFGLNTGTPVYHVSGTILDGSSRPIPGTGVNIEPGGHTDIADGSGNYVVYGLTPGSYTIYPTGDGHNFNPTEITVFVINDNVNGQHFRTN